MDSGKLNDIIATMIRIHFRRILSAVCLVAFALSALQGETMHKLMAATHQDARPVSVQSGVALQDMSDCSSCDEQGMMDDACAAMCSSLPAMMPPSLVAATDLRSVNWSSISPALAGRSLTPDTSPPRS